MVGGYIIVPEEKAYSPIGGCTISISYRSASTPQSLQTIFCKILGFILVAYCTAIIIASDIIDDEVCKKFFLVRVKVSKHIITTHTKNK